MLGLRAKLTVETERMSLRLPVASDIGAWAELRQDSEAFLVPWEPLWSPTHLSRKSFSNRVTWAARAFSQGTALPLFLERRSDRALLGGITLDNIKPYLISGIDCISVGALTHQVRSIDISLKIV